MTAEAVKMTQLTPAQVAKILATAGSRRVEEAWIDADIKAGAPVNADGSLNLVHYTAWLVRMAAQGEKEPRDGA